MSAIHLSTMNTAKKKRDEKHLKLLREMTSQPPNNLCFDCNQKGPTYVNTTIGSFVCTTCCGILRGLSPPHRVKSISMTSFIASEMEDLQRKGNQYCRAVWLGLWDEKKDMPVRTGDDNKLRDFLIQKYDRKRYYLDPVEAAKNLSTQCSKKEVKIGTTSAPSGTASTSTTSIPRTKTQSPRVSSPSASIPTVSTTPSVSTFANFDTATIFTDTNTPSTASKPLQTPTPAIAMASTGILQPQNKSASPANAAASPVQSNADRYAALKFLDEELKTNLEPGVQGINIASSSSSAAASPPNYFTGAFGATGTTGSNGNNLFASPEGAGAFGAAGSNGNNLFAPPEGAGAFGVPGSNGNNLFASPEGAGAFGVPGSNGNNLVASPEGAGAFGAAGSNGNNLFAPEGAGVNGGINGNAFAGVDTVGGNCGVFGSRGVNNSSPFSASTNGSFPNGGNFSTAQTGVFGTPPTNFGATNAGPGDTWSSLISTPASTQATTANPFTGVCGPPPPVNSNYNPFAAGAAESSLNNNGGVPLLTSVPTKPAAAPNNGTTTNDNWANFNAFSLTSNAATSPTNADGINANVTTNDNWANFNNIGSTTQPNNSGNGVKNGNGNSNWADFGAFGASENKNISGADPWGTTNVSSSGANCQSSFNPFI